MKQIAVGRFGSPHGVKGWVKVISYTNPIENILHYLPWTIKNNNQTLTTIEKMKSAVHGKHVVVQFDGCNDRDAAKAFTNLEIFVDRAQLPMPSNDEYYWVDLIGLSVKNQQSNELGYVDQLFATGSNDVLVVKDNEGKERYIPFIKEVIIDVDFDQKTILIDWDASF